MNLTPRTVTHDGVSYRVVRLACSGVGVQYACTLKGNDGKEQTRLLTEEGVEKSPSDRLLFEACARRFDDTMTLAKYLGSSSFWQSQQPPTSDESSG